VTDDKTGKNRAYYTERSVPVKNIPVFRVLSTARPDEKDTDGTNKRELSR